MFGAVFGQIITGFIVKNIASFDDTLTRVPVLVQLTRTFRGRVAFSAGTLLALTAIVVIALFFSEVLDLIPFQNEISAALIFLLAIAIYFDILVWTPEKKLEEKMAHFQPEAARMAKLVWVGFIVSFVTLIDDIIILMPLFIGDRASNIYSLIGVYAAAIIQIIAVIYFSHRLERIKYKKEIASFALAVLAVLVLAGAV